MPVTFPHAQVTGSRRFSAAAVALTLLGLTALAAGGWVRLAPPTAAAGSAVSRAAQGERMRPLQVVRFALHDAGILPREASVTRGRVLVSLTDYTGGSRGLVLERETPAGRERVGSVERERGGGWRGREELQLGPGTYRVYDAERPDIQSTLAVEP